MNGKQSHTATAGVIARPPLLFLGTLLLGIAADRLLPLQPTVPGDSQLHWFAGGGLIVVGLAFAIAGIRNFTGTTPIPTNEPTTALVTTGIHGWSRNPIYVGFFLIYVGIGVAAASAWILALSLPLAFVMRYGVVGREEAYLDRLFGDAYRDYKRRVPRWL